jgi:hypothetical protein
MMRKVDSRLLDWYFGYWTQQGTVKLSKKDMAVLASGLAQAELAMVVTSAQT